MKWWVNVDNDGHFQRAVEVCFLQWTWLKRKATKPSISTGSCVTSTKSWVCWDPLASTTQAATARLCSKSRAWRPFLKIRFSNPAASTHMSLLKRSKKKKENQKKSPKTVLLDLDVLACYLQSVHLFLSSGLCRSSEGHLIVFIVKMNCILFNVWYFNVSFLCHSSSYFIVFYSSMLKRW